MIKFRTVIAEESLFLELIIALNCSIHDIDGLRCSFISLVSEFPIAALMYTNYDTLYMLFVLYYEHGNASLGVPLKKK